MYHRSCRYHYHHHGYPYYGYPYYGYPYYGYPYYGSALTPIYESPYVNPYLSAVSLGPPPPTPLQVAFSMNY